MALFPRALFVALGVATAGAQVGCTDSSSTGSGRDLAVGDASGAADGHHFDFGPVDPSCAEVKAMAKLNKVDLLFLLDRSGSMGDGVNGDPTQKWNPVTATLKQFFADPKSKGLRASLEFFPADGNDICNSSTYYFPATTLTALPNSSFATSIDATMPMGETPTLPAIIGTIDYGVDSLPTTPSDRTAIVLVTDGLPAGCESSVTNVSTECAKVRLAHEINTYVIGVGDNLSGLQKIAEEGGTTAPVILSVGDPAKTSADFLTALESVRGSTLSCAFDIPALDPSNGAIDFEKVNVQYTPAGGSATAVPRSQDCAFASGWRYDDPNTPKKVELCPDLCNQVRNDEMGKMEIIFGCATIIF